MVVVVGGAQPFCKAASFPAAELRSASNTSRLLSHRFHSKPVVPITGPAHPAAAAEPERGGGQSHFSAAASELSRGWRAARRSEGGNSNGSRRCGPNVCLMFLYACTADARASDEQREEGASTPAQGRRGRSLSRWVFCWTSPEDV